MNSDEAVIFDTPKEEEPNDPEEVHENFNEQEIQDFFGVDPTQMEEIVRVSSKYFNATQEPSSCRTQKVDPVDSERLEIITRQSLEPMTPSPFS